MASTIALLREEAFYSKLNPYLDEINKKCIAMNDNKELCVETTMNVIDALINQLKNQNPDFVYFFNGLTYVGSYFDGLRVKEATEFDLNINLKIPCYLEKIKIENSPRTPGYVRINVKDAMFKHSEFYGLPAAREWMNWIDEEKYLLPYKILNWLDSVFSKISDGGILHISTNGKRYMVTRSKNGPANTLHISEGGINIDVDLVPVIQFPSTIRPPVPVRWNEEMNAPWIVVPKPMADNTIWRLSFPEQERKLMNGQNHLKFVNRYLKRFRDVKGLNISSYYIKSLFLWEAHEKWQNHDEIFWNKPVSYLFVYMLVKLAESLEKKSLKFYWHTELNLYRQNWSPTINENLENMKGYVIYVIKSINQLIERGYDPAIRAFICQIFGV